MQLVKELSRWFFLIMLLMGVASCGEQVFTAKVRIVDEPRVLKELTADKIETDFLYSEYFSVWDSLLISSCPGTTDFNFHVADLKNNRELGSFMRRGQGPEEHLGLTPISMFEQKGNDLVAVTFDPFKKQLLEWNITKSIELGRDSVLYLGHYTNSNDYELTYAKIYRLENSKYLGYTPGMTFITNHKPLKPTYFILEGKDNAPTSGISIINNSAPYVEGFSSSGLSLSPDKSKIVDVMSWLAQINIIDLPTGTVKSYRLTGSPDENGVEELTKTSEYQYHDVACNDKSIFALYSGQPIDTYNENGGCYLLHEYDWNGNLEAKYRLPVPVVRLWFDGASNSLYGYCEVEDAVYRLNI